MTRKLVRRKGERYRMPRYGRHECPNCGVRAETFDEMTEVFGWRRSPDGPYHTIQSWCRSCRGNCWGLKGKS